MKVKLCKDCKWSSPDPSLTWNLRCKNPEVNARDAWALTQANFSGSECRSEREKLWVWLGPCGMKGRLWELKNEI